ncbi:MAG TPA: lipopolysaccharide biosynthesis protein [Beijerinckiaceae bacterium]|jgi:O-antigen/teichoic acid export membrane protein
MAIVLTFILNAGLNFALGLVVAYGLGPEDFGRYALGAAVAVALNALLFDWLRLAATRFYSAKTRADEPALRATLELGYAGFSLLLAAVVVGAVWLDLDLGLPALMLAAAAATGICMGLFDYQVALARALFQERSYALLVAVKNLAAFALMVVGACLLKDPTLTLLGSGLSAAAALLIARKALAEPNLRLDAARLNTAAAFARYALPLVVANVAYQCLPLLNRGALAATDGFGAAGRFALAADIGARLFMTLGSALDIALFQLAVRADEREGRAAAEARVATNAALIAALLLPLAAGYALILPVVEALAVPAEFRGAFASHSLVLIPAFLAFSLILYALNPVFQLRKETGPLAGAALVAVAVNALLLVVLPAHLGPVGVSAAQLGGLSAALAVVLAAALARGFRAPWAAFGKAALATMVMALAVAPLREAGPPVAALAAMTGTGLLVYAACAAALDVAGLRSVALRWWRTRNEVPAEA